MFFIVPDDISDAIYAAIDAAIKLCPAAVPDREEAYRVLVNYYAEYGVIPPISFRPLRSDEVDAAIQSAERHAQ